MNRNTALSGHKSVTNWTQTVTNGHKFAISPLRTRAPGIFLLDGSAHDLHKLSLYDNLEKMNLKSDPSLDTLLDLDGVVFALNDEPSPYWVKFVVKRIPASRQRPHGLSYSLTLHDPQGKRVLGFDNAHSVREGSGPGSRTRIEHDHQHHRKSIRFYDYQDAGTLIKDFWEEVETFLKEQGVLP